MGLLNAGSLIALQNHKTNYLFKHNCVTEEANVTDRNNHLQLKQLQ